MTVPCLTHRAYEQVFVVAERIFKFAGCKNINISEFGLYQLVYKPGTHLRTINFHIGNPAKKENACFPLMHL